MFHIVRDLVYITTILKHWNIKMYIYVSLNYSNIQHNLNPKTHNHQKFSATRLYKLTYPDCSKPYIGQTERSILKRYNEHNLALRNNCHSSKLWQHLNGHIHTFSPINNIMKILCLSGKKPIFKQYTTPLHPQRSRNW
jgi:hypothetical protein